MALYSSLPVREKTPRVQKVHRTISSDLSLLLHCVDSLNCCADSFEGLTHRLTPSFLFMHGIGRLRVTMFSRSAAEWRGRGRTEESLHCTCKITVNVCWSSTLNRTSIINDYGDDLMSSSFSLWEGAVLDGFVCMS